MYAKEELFDKEVISRSGIIVGKVKDVIIDTTNWHVTAIQVQLDKDVAQLLHLKRHMVGSVNHPISVSLVQGVSDKVVLNSDAVEFPEVSAKPGEGHVSTGTATQQSQSAPSKDTTTT